MKAIMYHYVREFNSKFPYFRYLDINNFEKQLDYFEQRYGFVSKEEWLEVIAKKKLGSTEGKIILTFDDAMSCHYDYVFQVLKKRGLWGVFYVPSQPYQNNKILDVHKIHLLCGAFEGRELIAILKDLIDESMIPDKKIKEFRELTYSGQTNYEGVSEFKRILNYFVSYRFREQLIDAVANEFDFEFTVSEFYISLDELKEMHISGNLIGSHSVSHPVMSKLDEINQRVEINDSLIFLHDNLNLDVKTYCHPYGGFHSFDKSTVEILTSCQVSFSFNVEPRDISNQDLVSSIQFLPRYDCNMFPFGEAS